MKDVNDHSNHARIAKAKHSINQKSTLAPYMLFPLRLETHFRTHKVSSRPDNEREIEKVMTTFAAIISKLHQHLVLPDEKDVAPLETLPKALYDLRGMIEEMDLIPAEDKGALQSVSQMLKRTIKKTVKKQAKTKITPYIDTILRATKELETSSALKRNKTTLFLEDLREAYTALDTLSKYTKTPYRNTDYYKNPSHTKDNVYLSRYITGHVINLNRFFKSALHRLKELPSIDNRQQKAAAESMAANRFRSWQNRFNSVRKNLRKIYVEEDYVTLKKHLLDRYDNDWEGLLEEAEENCKDFTHHFDKVIEGKPTTSFSYIRPVQSILQLEVTLLEKNLEEEPYQFFDLKKELQRIRYLLEKTTLDYPAEQKLLQHLISDLQNRIKVYTATMKKEGYADFSRSNRNKALIQMLSSDLIKGHPLQKEEFKPQNQLCVRIFPDEVFIHQHDEKLTKEEADDAKTFWIKWFIASGNRKHEKEAWDILWQKHGVMRASWMVRTLRPKRLDDYLPERPFLNNKQMEEALKKLADLINKPDFKSDRRQKENEKILLLTIQKMLSPFYQAREIVMQYDKIVDYLFDETVSELSYVQRRLNSFIEFYDENPNYKQPDVMAYRDTDYLSLSSFYKEVTDLLAHLKNKRISLEDMVAFYKQRLSKNDPFFPHLKSYKSSDEFAPPTSAIMPDRFLFIGFTKTSENGSERRIVYAGRRVKKRLQLGFDPSEDPNINPYDVNTDTGELNVRGGIKWMTDYETAVKSGMAITVPLPHRGSAFEKAKFSSIYVLGIKDSMDHNTLKRFFNAHIYGHTGLDFLKIGTPTNNLDEVVSGYNSDEAILENIRFEIDVEESYKGQNEHLYRAIRDILGFDKEEFDAGIGRVNSFDNNEIQKAVDTNTIMSEVFEEQFQSTGGDVTAFTKKMDAFLKSIPDFVSHYSMARGIVPPLRIGNQPYGILPTTAFFKLEFEPLNDSVIKDPNKDPLRFARQLLELLKRITHTWSEIKKKHVIHSENLGTENPQERYMEMMGLTATSTSFFERTLIESLPLLHAAINYAPLEEYGVHLAKILKDIFKIELPKNLENNWLLDELKIFRTHPVAKMVQELRDETHEDPDIGPFMDKVLSDNMEELKTKVPEKEIPALVAEFMDLFTYRLDAWWTGLVNYQLHRMRAGTFGKTDKNVNVGAFGWLFNLEKSDLTKISKRPVGNHKEIAEEMKLSDKEAPILHDEDHCEFMLAPSIHHALTAAIMRSSYKNSKKGKKDSRLCINLSSLRVRQALRIIDGVQNGLSIGAILGSDLERALHEAYKSPKQESAMELDRYVYPLRQLFPLKVAIKSQQKGAEAESYLMTVINGELLLNKALKNYDDSRRKSVTDYLLQSNNAATKWFDDLFKDTPTKYKKGHKKGVALLIEQIADSFDALSDLVVSEGVYQLVQGNRVAFTAWMKSLKDGSFSADPEVARIPMHSAVIRHKAGISLPNQNNTNTPEWDSIMTLDNENGDTLIEQIDSPMSDAAPALNNWMGQLLGASMQIYFNATIIKKESQQEKNRSCSLKELGISPLEYLYLSNNENLFKRFLTLKLRKKFNYYAEIISIDIEGKEENTSGRSVFENKLILKEIRGVLADSRPLNAHDFVADKDQNAETKSDKGYDLEELRTRYDNLVNCHIQLRIKLNRFLNTALPHEADFISQEEFKTFNNLFLEGAKLGIMEALTTLPTEEDWGKKSQENDDSSPQSFIKGLKKIHNQIDKRLEKAESIIEASDPTNEDSVVTSIEEAVQQLLTDDFKIFPYFTMANIPSKKRNQYEQQLQENFGYKNARPMDLESWVSEVAKVRKPMGCFQRSRMVSEFRNDRQREMTVLQFPFDVERDTEWLGREVSTEEQVEDKESLFLYNKENFSTIRNDTNIGLVFDRWMELIPYRHQNGGVVFNYDQPDAEAPQTILLAIPAKINMRKKNKNEYRAKNWTLDELIETLHDTKIMAENRAVEPDHLYAEEALAKILPLLQYDRKGVSKEDYGTLLRDILNNRNLTVNIGIRNIPGTFNTKVIY